MINKFYIISFLALLSACSLLSIGESQKAKNAIFVIADGMGPAQITGARIYKNDSNTPLFMERMENLALARTHSSDNFVTDSAASATALATGHKTYNGSISMSDPQIDLQGKSRELKTLTDYSLENGKSVGIVTNTRITHATPAAFFANVPHRRMELEIAYQLTQRDLDLVIGGGLEYFLPKSKGGLRNDGLDLIEKMETRGYKVVTSYEAFSKLSPSLGKPLFAILEEDHFSYVADRDEHKQSLDFIVDFSIRYLNKRNNNGYFLMVESGRIDHASHINNAYKTFEEMLELDDVMNRALKEVADTLVVLTADHETGGLALNGYAPIKSSSGKGLLKKYPRDMRGEHFYYELVTWASGPGFNQSDGDPLDKEYQQKATLNAPFAYHTAVDVPTLAEGPGAEVFRGYIDNTDIFRFIMQKFID